jgi:hypothetical protein
VPDNSISAEEILDEPGVNQFEKTDWHYIGQGANPVAGVSTTFPAPGYALVVGSVQMFIDSRPYPIETAVSVSKYSNQHGNITAVQHYNEHSTVHRQSLTVHDIIAIDAAGPQTLWLMGSFWSSPPGDSTQAKGHLTILYVPTSYGATQLSSTPVPLPETSAVSPGMYETVSAPTELESLRASLEMELQALREEIAALKEGR